ncbi:MAG: DUF881 domain-containing protein [Firmicutes bacterium]|nr:DUF881 domain-containing protein [Bacillota bacterium]
MKGELKDWILFLSLGCFALGVLIAFQFKGQEKEGFPLAAYRSMDVIQILQNSQKQNAALETQISKLRTRLTEYEISRSQKGSLTRELGKELEKARMEAGMIAVKGPGIKIILNDSTRKPKPGEGDYFYLVHDVDLTELTNELWSAGAEAVSINNERIIADSPIRCVGPAVLVNTLHVSPPYVVKAIGNPAALSTALEMQGGFLDVMQVSIAHGVTIQLTEEKKLIIPAYGGSMAFHYALPIFNRKTQKEP